ncbi:MAG TPA: hypothetical protein VNK73_14090, partial [Actinomycetota bacterium]|nr:hypothetical protein [Actinomycetota bacterium]
MRPHPGHARELGEVGKGGAPGAALDGLGQAQRRQGGKEQPSAALADGAGGGQFGGGHRAAVEPGKYPEALGGLDRRRGGDRLAEVGERPADRPRHRRGGCGQRSTSIRPVVPSTVTTWSSR